MANEMSAVKARYLSREAREYARALAHRSTEALKQSIKDHSGFLNMASADLVGGLAGWSLDVASRLATLKAAKPGADGVRGWIGRNATNISATLSSTVGAGGYVLNAWTNKTAPLSWWREAGRTASGTLSIFGLDRFASKALKIPPLV